MAGARRGTNKTFSLAISDISPVGNVIDLPGIDASKPHCFLGVQFFADASGSAPAVPTVGSVVIEVKTINTTPLFEPVPGGTINASAPTTISWAANTIRVRATPSGVDVATHYRLVVTCNET